MRGPGVGLDADEGAAGSYEHSMVTFPNAANDDDVDATTQYLNHVRSRGLATLEAAMANMQRFFAPGRAQPPPTPASPPEAPTLAPSADEQIRLALASSPRPAAVTQNTTEAPASTGRGWR